MAAKAVVNLASVDGQRSLPINAAFFTGYRQTALKSNEVLVSIEIPFTTEVSILYVIMGYSIFERLVDTFVMIE